MTGETTVFGKITISPKAIATLASQAAMQSYGVVGLASKNIVEGITHVLARDPRHGVEINATESELLIDIYVIIEYGTRITSVARSVANSVRFQVERAIGLPVAEVNVHVQDLRISDTD
ncbi:MAG: Asp23/Gls24 family envelope stress response protein [Anaerolineales bacterium]|jgi:uncharacterized alkaline shock family protein YloU